MTTQKKKPHDKQNKITHAWHHIFFVIPLRRSSLSSSSLSRDTLVSLSFSVRSFPSLQSGCQTHKAESSPFPSRQTGGQTERQIDWREIDVDTLPPPPPPLPCFHVVYRLVLLLKEFNFYSIFLYFLYTTISIVVFKSSEVISY